MMRLGVIGALEPEIRAFGARAPSGHFFLPSVCGTGADRARSAGKRLIAEGATALVSWGTAAALVPALRPGTLLLPEKVIAWDGREYAVDAEWHGRIRKRLPADLPVHTGALAEARQPLLTAADKRMLGERSGAAAADMESAALASLAREAGVPLLVVRAVVDSAGMAVPAPLAAAIRADGGLRVVSTVARLAISPLHWLPAVRLAWGFRAALLTLARVAPEVRA